MYCINLQRYISAIRAEHWRKNLSLSPLILQRVRKEFYMDTGAWNSCALLKRPTCLSEFQHLGSAWFWCTQIKLPLEETKMKLSFQKFSSAPWRQWVLSHGVGHIATRCYIKYLCCEEALDSSTHPIKHLFWHSNEQVSSLLFYLSTTVMPQLFLQRHFIFCRGTPGSTTFPFGYQSNPAIVSYSSLQSLFLCQSIRHLPILLEVLQTLDRMTSFIKLWDEEGETFLDSWITLHQYQQVASSVAWNFRR